MSGAAVTAGALLEALVRAAETRVDPAPLLHERVALHRLDGEVLRGRAAVVDAVCTREGGLRLVVLAVEHSAVQVALELADVPGQLRFWMRGEARAGVLLEVRMEP